MQVTSVEFQRNPERYLNLVMSEDIWISRDGAVFAKLTKPDYYRKKSAVDAICGILEGKVPKDIDRKAIREERLARYEADG